MLIFDFMANELKSKTPKVAEKPEKKEKVVKVKKATTAKTATGEKFRKEKEEKVDLKKLAKDERTQKIMGTVSLLVSAFLFISFSSYFFTRTEDYSEIHNQGISFLFDTESKVANLLGRLGAYASHILIRQGFGLASFLFCCFFFVVGINKLTGRKVYSVLRNLRYVTIGLLILSVALAFLFTAFEFPFGGEVGTMIKNWLVGLMGNVGTACLLLVVGVSYSIWQFNPTFHFPERQKTGDIEAENPLEMAADEEERTEDEEPEEKVLSPITLAKQKAATINDLYAGKELEKPSVPNVLNGNGEMVLSINPSVDENNYGFEVVERDEPDEDEVMEEPEEDIMPVQEPAVEPVVGDILHQEEDLVTKELPPHETKIFIEQPRSSKPAQPVAEEFQLEIKTVEEVPAEEAEELQKDYSDLPPYEPTLDLRDYKYPG